MAGILTSLAAKLTLDTKGYRSGLQEAEKKTGLFASNLKGLGNIVKGGAFATGIAIIAEYGGVLADLNKDIDNSRRAFERFGDSKLFEQLEMATGGMVSDLKLIQQAIQATNLGLKSQDLPDYFRFATIRAAETGMEVDHLVESIVTGIGRESRLVLDNLGISLKALNAEIAKGGTFSEAATRLIKKYADQSNTSVEQATKGTKALTSAWSNLATEIADSRLGEMFNDIAVGVAYLLNKFSDPNLTPTIKFEFDANGVFDGIKELGQLTDDWLKKQDLKTLQEELKVQQKLFDTYQKYVTSDEYMLFKDSGVEELENAANRASLAFDYIGENVSKLTEIIAAMKAEISGITHPIVKPLTMSSIGEGYTIDPIQNDLLAEGTALLIKHIDAQNDLNDSQYKMIGMSSAMKKASQDASDYIREQTAAIAEMNRAISNLAAEGIAAFAEMLGEMIGGGGIENSLKNFIGKIGGLLKSFGAMLIAYGVSLEVLQKSMNPALMIAAGAALVVIGAAISTKTGSIQAASGGSSAGGSSYSSGSSSGGTYDYNREIILTARGNDLVAVLNSTNQQQSYFGG